MSIPLNIDWQQILLHLFNFAILAGGLYLLLYRPVKQFMEQREEHYRALQQTAQQAQDLAAELEAQCRDQAAQAEEEITRRRADAEQELDQFRTRRIADAQQEAEEILTKARAAARRERAEMVTKASKELMDAAIIAAEKITLGTNGDPYEQFLSLVERGSSDGQTR